MSSRFIELAEHHIENGSLYEVIWLLFTLRGLKKSFNSKKITELSETVQSSALRLLLLDMDQLGLCIKQLPKSIWEQEISVERCLSDWTWLYAYEAVRKGWLRAKSTFINSSFIKPMYTREIEFYNQRRNVSLSSKIKSERFKMKKINDLQIEVLLKQLRGINHFFELDSEY